MTAPETAPETAPGAEPSGRTGLDAPDRGKRLADLARGDCRFPLGNPARRARRFCGHPARPGGPYCDAHHAIAYLAPTPDGQPDDAAKEEGR